MAEGVELLGRYQGSGCREAPYLARRGDGGMLEISPLLHLVASHLRTEQALSDVAREVGGKLHRPITADDIAYLVEHKLEPLGLVRSPEGSRAAPAAAPMLGLAVHTGVVPARLVGAVSGLLRPLFAPAAIIVSLLGLTAVDARLLPGHGIGRHAHQLPFEPGWVLALIGLTLASGLFHELGHATASRYGGAEPGRIGVGVYLIWPVFYNDLNDSYRLNRAGRLRADLGGVYFNVVFILGLAAVYGLTGSAPLLVGIVIQHVAIAQQFLPFVRLDGYYVVSDVAGVPDLFGRIRPILASLVPGRQTGAEVAALKPQARAAVTLWVLATVPLLVACLALLVLTLPALLVGAWQSTRVEGLLLADAIRDGAPVRAALAGVQLLVLTVPFAGLTTLAVRVSTGGRRAIAHRRMRRPPTTRDAVVSEASPRPERGLFPSIAILASATKAALVPPRRYRAP